MAGSHFVRRAALAGLLVAFICPQGGRGEARSAVSASERLARLLPFEDLYAVAVPAPGRAVAVGSWGRVLRTEDGGQTWHAGQAAAPRTLLAVRFADERHGWIVGEQGTVLATADGGVSWEERPAPTARHLFALAVLGGEHLWVVGDRGALFESADGGRSWLDHTLPDDVILNDVVFADAQRGWIVGEFGTILRTTDGGRTWTPAEVIEGAPEEVYLYSVAFDDGRGVATGLGGVALESRDDGRAWKRIPSGTRNHLFEVAFARAASGPGTPAESEARLPAPSSIAVSVGDQGEIRLFGSDAKAPDALAEATLWLRGVAFRGAEGYAVGASSQILRSTDGGRHWVDVAGPARAERRLVAAEGAR